MSSSAQITEAREEVRRTRERLDRTYGEITEQLVAPVRRTASALNLAEAVRNHPWPALAVAVGAGIVAGSSGLDRRIATAAADTARQAGRKTVSTVRSARTVPARARGRLALATDSLAVRLLTSFMGALRERNTTEPGVPAPDAIGFVRVSTPATGDDLTS